MDKGPKRKIIFLGHDASLTGAPVLLLNLIRLLFGSGKYETQLVLGRAGPLLGQYRESVTVYVLKPADYGNENNFVRKVFNYLTYKYRLRAIRKVVRNADIIFSNTVANGRILKEIAGGKKVLLYVHELSSVIESFNKNKDAELSFKISDKIIVPSTAVKNALIDHYKLSEQKISFLPYYFPITMLKSDKTNARRSFCEKYKIPFNNFLVVGMGAATHRKGFDMFMDVASSVALISNEISFIWIGDFIDSKMREEFLRSDKKVHVTGYLPHKPENLLPFDLFLLTSREDPYPLVVLEAAQVNLPTICFKESGGITDFVTTETGWSITEFHTEAVAKLIIELKKTPELINRKGQVAHSNFINLHSNAGRILDQFHLLIEKTLEC
jgi:glycosyltransferase involved in cell wall biosynthesis